MPEPDINFKVKPFCSSTIIVKLLSEPKTFFEIIRDSEALENRKEAIERGDESPFSRSNIMTCPYCEKSHPIIRKVRFKVYEIKKRIAFDMELPEDAARTAFTDAYNTLWMKINRAIEARGFWTKIKSLFREEPLVFPSPGNTIWTIIKDQYDNVTITADVE